MRKDNSPGIQVLSKTNIQFTYNPYYTTICRKAQPYLAPRIVMLLSLQVQVWQRLPIAILSGKLVCRQGRGEANKGGRGEEREKQGEGEARERRGGGWGRESEDEAGGSVSVNQIEGEEGLYSESNRGRGRGEGGKSEGEVGEERGREWI